MTFICCDVGLFKVSLATTVMVFGPECSAIVALQFAVPDPMAVSLFAVMPLTVTVETPLLPSPLSLAMPLTGRLALVTTALLAGEPIVSAGAVVSGKGMFTVRETVDEVVSLADVS